MIHEIQNKTGFDNTSVDVDYNTILIVEDQKLLAWDIEQTLQEFGYQRFQVTTSVKGAQSLIRQHRRKFSLAILDLKLEDGDGTILIDELRSYDIKILVATGYDISELLHIPVLHKPFTSAALVGAVRALLKD